MEDSEQIKHWETKIRTAAWFGVFSAGGTVILSLASLYFDSIKALGIDLWSVADAAVVAGLAYGTYRKNRWAAFFQILMLIVGKLAILTQVEIVRMVPIIIGTGLFLTIYVLGAIAAFELHSHEETKREEAGILPEPKGIGYYVLFGLGSVLVLTIIVFVYVGLVGPEVEAVSGDKMKAKYKDFVMEKKLLDPKEKILFWYSDAFLDFRESFSFYTDKKLVLYQAELVEDPVIILPYSKIEDFELDLDNFKIVAYLKEEEGEVHFPVPSATEDARKYFDNLVKEWAK